MTIGDYIKQIRQFMKMTQQELALKAGISYQQLSQYERSVRKPKNKTLEKIAEALGFSFLEFMNLYYSSLSTVEFNDKSPSLLGKMLNEAITPEEQDELNVCSRLNRIARCLDKLNEEGKAEAEKRVKELSEIPRYQAQSLTMPPELKEDHEE